MTETVSFDLSVKNAVAISFAAGLLLGVVVGGAGALTLQSESQPLEAASGSTGSSSSVTQNSDTGSQGSQDLGSDTVSVSDMTWEDDPKLGSENAEVTLVWFSDLNCMYCRRFAQNTFPQIRENYVSNGDIQVVKKDFITMGENSITLAKASQAAWQLVGEDNPEVFWTWSDTISKNQPERKRNSKSVTEDIVSTTREVDGIDAEQLRQKMKEISEDEINQDVQDGRQRGISGTPGFLIFKTGSDEAKQMTGAQPYSSFESEINKLLES